MITKYPLNAQRLRKVPNQFSWVDQRLVRERRISDCTVAGAALYLFLVTVADAQGLSYFGDMSIARYLGMPVADVAGARENLIQADLIAYKKPLYQVLSLDPSPEKRSAMLAPLSLGEIMKKAMEGCR
jgi:hypothetical protein